MDINNGNNSNTNICNKNKTAKIIGHALFFGALQLSLSTIELIPRLMIHSHNTQEALNNACKSLRDYMIIGISWTIATCLVMYAQYGFFGLFAGLVCNMVYICWIFFSYRNAFRKNAEKNGLTVPNIFCKSV